MARDPQGSAARAFAPRAPSWPAPAHSATDPPATDPLSLWCLGNLAKALSQHQARDLRRLPVFAPPHPTRTTTRQRRRPRGRGDHGPSLPVLPVTKSAVNGAPLSPAWTLFGEQRATWHGGSPFFFHWRRCPPAASSATSDPRSSLLPSPAEKQARPDARRSRRGTARCGRRSRLRRRRSRFL
ncbi:unnamed protein product, partial [Ixodes pacificus]